MTARSATARIGSTYAPYATQLVVGTHHAVADEPVDLGGGDTGPAPDEMLLSALGACTAITLRMYAERKQWPIEGVEVELAYEERGKEKTVIRRTVHLRGPLDESQRERLLQIANACPVHRILTGAVEVPTALA
jgi:putative redox protein